MFEGHTNKRPWSIDVPLCPEHLSWYERRPRQLLFFLIPLILGTSLGLLALFLSRLSLVEEGNIVTWGLLIAGITFFVIGLYLGVKYWIDGRNSIQAVKITGDSLKLGGVSPKVADSINQQWEQRFLQRLRESPLRHAPQEGRDEPPNDWRDITG
jgi:hypothetical protein